MADVAAPTERVAFYKAVLFARYTVGVDGALEVSASGRLKGVARLAFCKKRALLQRPPLRVDDVKRLEQILGDETSDRRARVAAGACLFCPLARACYSDAHHVRGFGPGS